MTAGAGIVHEEFHSPAFTEKGGTLEMVQLWVNLPARHKNAPPAYQTLVAADIPVVPLDDDGSLLRVVAGEYDGRRGPAKTFTPINVWDARLSSGSDVLLCQRRLKIDPFCQEVAEVKLTLRMLGLCAP